MTLVALLFLLVAGTVTASLFFIYSGTEDVESTSSSPGGYLGSSNTTPSPTTTTTKTALSTVTTKGRATTSTNPGTTPSTTASTTPSTMPSTRASATPRMTPSTKASTTQCTACTTPSTTSLTASMTRSTSTTPSTTRTAASTTESINSPMATTTNTWDPQNAPHSTTATRATTAVPTVTTAKTASTMRITTPNATPITTPTTTPITIPSVTNTTPNTWASITSPTATTTNTSAAQGRPMNPKTIMCTFGDEVVTAIVGPKDGVCDIIIFDFLYAKGRGTFLKHDATPLRWFLNYVKNNTGTTEFGLGIDHSKSSIAAKDLSKMEARDAARDFWSLKLRHYGLLKLPLRDSLVSRRQTARKYIKLFEKLRQLQEAIGTGKSDEPGYLILGIGLYTPPSDAVHVYLEDILQNATIDGVVIRTHLEDDPYRRVGCKITGPNVYTDPPNMYEVSMVEALDYARSHHDLFRGRSLMVSFSMSVLLTRPKQRTSDDDYQFGKDCKRIRFVHIHTICKTRNANYLGSLVPIQRVMHGIDTGLGLVSTYDSPDTIKWKICMSTMRDRTLQFGVALFSLGYEDGSTSCNQYNFKNLSGYWRAEGVSRYMKNVIRKNNFSTINATCQ